MMAKHMVQIVSETFRWRVHAKCQGGQPDAACPGLGFWGQPSVQGPRKASGGLHVIIGADVPFQSPHGILELLALMP